MPTGRSVVATCAARAALAGNPSDGYGGAVVAVPVPDLCATVAATEADEFGVVTSDPDLRRLLSAAADGFAESVGPLPQVTVSASTTIPRSVGLAGSSALVIAALRALGGWSEHQWDRIALAELALSIERDRLGIAAGLQDRLVQAVGSAVAMTFDPVGYAVLNPDPDLPLFVAWSRGDAQPSGTVHRSLRRRYDAGDEQVHDTMRALVVQARRAERAIRDRDATLLGEAMDATADLRPRLVEVPASQQRMIAIGRASGAAVNSAGSGGSVVGLASRRDRLDDVIAAYRSEGLEAIELFL